MTIKDCDDVKIGLIMKQLPLSSLQLNHKKISSTVKDYIVPRENNIELEYVVDLFTLTTTEVVEKWFDGEENAYQLTAQLDSLMLNRE